jgi:hypothetical protein
LLQHPDQFLSKREIAEAAGLTLLQTSNVIRSAWKLGWVERLEQHLNDCAFGKQGLHSLRTRYRIKRRDEWIGIKCLHKRVLAKEKKNAKTN